MNKKLLSGIIATTTVFTGTMAIAAPANASILDKNDSVWSQTSNVQDRSTDTSGFQSIVNDFQKFVQQERLEIPDNKLRKIDPNKLTLKNDYDVRAWFINEGAAHKNQLAYETTKDGQTTGKGMIFNNISCIADCELSNPDDGVLNIGDYVDIGTVLKGEKLNFSLKANGYNNPNGHVFGAPDQDNPDGLAHTVSYLYRDKDSGKDYVMIGFEDIFGPKENGSDRDFNDAVFVVDLGNGNVAGVPEPATATAVLGVGALGALAGRRRKKKSA
ncbi:MAG: DUF4114 domain-containing protein [Cyanobacteria bacterium P01_A01_bin.84]